MLGAGAELLYVGKARNLKRRVSSYFAKRDHGLRIASMVGQVRSIEVTLTHTEIEALLLEVNLIKEHRPRYNVLLRDDKSYPHLCLTWGHDYPRLTSHRGAQDKRHRYFGPYPSKIASDQTINTIQKIFRIRTCRDSFFANRSRPCLQHQIKRCSAPCVDLISQADYRRDVNHVAMVLAGRDQHVADDLVQQMEQASTQLDFEVAARLRDQIRALKKVQSQQSMTGSATDADVVVAAQRGGTAAIVLLFVRQGRVLGHKAFFPASAGDADEQELLHAFISQHYLSQPPPAELILGQPLDDAQWLCEVIERQHQRRFKLRTNPRGDARRWQEMAANTLNQAIDSRLAMRSGTQQRFADLANQLQLDEVPQRLECFDISHTMGEATVASCVVFDHDGPRKADYRRYNIEGITGGDDYAAMEQVLRRRYQRVAKGEVPTPDMVLIDGGKGQLQVAEQIFAELQLSQVLLLGVAKGVDRRAGQEQLFLSGHPQALILPSESAGLHLVQHIRDEAHRFAITAHRQRRGKARTQSVLEGIEGLGPKRRQALLKHFGGLQGVQAAASEDLARVPGISKALAQRVHAFFHTD